MKKIATVLTSFFLFFSVGCTTAAGVRRVGAEALSASADGDVFFSGCLTYIEDGGVTFLLSPRCDSWAADREGKSLIDVDTDGSVSKGFISANRFPVCVEVHGRLEKYRYSQDDFLIPSGYLRSSVGMIFPNKISAVNCSENP